MRRNYKVIDRFSQEAFARVFEREDAKKLLTPKWRKKNMEKGAPDSTGFCYIASEVAYWLFKYRNPQVYCASYKEKNGEKCTHWWLVLPDGSIYDPTADQYTKLGKTPPYHLGRKRSFLTKHMSKRADKLCTLHIEEMHAIVEKMKAGNELL